MKKIVVLDFVTLFIGTKLNYQRPLKTGIYVIPNSHISN